MIDYVPKGHGIYAKNIEIIIAFLYSSKVNAADKLSKLTDMFYGLISFFVLVLKIISFNPKFYTYFSMNKSKSVG